MKVLLAAYLLGFGLFAYSQPSQTGPSTATGECAVSHSGNYDTITIQNCGIGEIQGEKIIELLKGLVANQDTATMNVKLDEILKMLSTSGIIPPPPRVITNDKAYPAIAVLKTAPKGSRVEFSIVGGGSEVIQFANQVGALFAHSDGIWNITGVNRTGEMEQMMSDGSVSHGEGFHCYVYNSSAAGEIAVKAMAVSGYSCERGDRQHNPTTENSAVDLLIEIGTRIIPPK